MGAGILDNHKVESTGADPKVWYTCGRRYDGADFEGWRRERFHAPSQALLRLCLYCSRQACEGVMRICDDIEAMGDTR